MSARRALAAQEGRRDGTVRFSGKGNDFVSGRDTPELFLSWQLYDTFLHGVFVADPDHRTLQRESFEDRLEEQHMVLPERFWQRLELASADYLSLLLVQHSMIATLNAATGVERRVILGDIEKSQQSNCGARQSALARVRTEFGETTFDRLLYIAVAPSLSVFGDSDRNMMSWVARGCPD